MRALALVLVLLSPEVMAQANLCGAGKNCSVNTLTAKKSTASSCAISIPNASVRVCMGAANNFWLSYNAGSGVADIESSAAPFRFLRGGSLTASEARAGTFTASYGYDAPLALASFPAAAAGNAGRLLYDSTNSVWRYSNGSAWVAMDREISFSGYMPTAALAAGYTVAKTTLVKPAVSKHLTAESPLGAGTTTTGNVTIVLYNVTAAAANCTLTVACNVGGATVACSTAAAAGDVLRLDVDTSACGGAGAFDYNITAQLAGG